MRIGLDIEQFVRDPYATGIQRVLLELARWWPQTPEAVFVVPVPEAEPGIVALMPPKIAVDLLSLPFLARDTDLDVRDAVNAFIREHVSETTHESELPLHVDHWMLPEVSYLPAVITRLKSLSRLMPTAMIGYDTLPQTEPANYRFKPGTSAWVSEYFRALTKVDSVVCISNYAAESIVERLRRHPARRIAVAHPGGDHLAMRESNPPSRPVFLRLGTVEARKRPVEILSAFELAVSRGLQADLVFVGGASASSVEINQAIEGAIERGLPVRWVRGASDHEVLDELAHASVFLSIGIEGYGIPVLEAIRLGTPVIFDGIQPAGDLMVGRGARRVPAFDVEATAAMFLEYGQQSRIDEVRSEIDPTGIPTWQDFARDVSRAFEGITP